MKEIALTKGKTAFVDDEDYERVSQYKWSASVAGGGCFRARCYILGVHVYLSHFIVGKPEIGVVDHRDRNALNNTRANLRFCTYSENGANAKIRKSKTGYKGVWTHRQKWRAAIRQNGKYFYLGSFETPKQAALAYDAAARERFGEFALTNF